MKDKNENKNEDIKKDLLGNQLKIHDTVIGTVNPDNTNIVFLGEIKSFIKQHGIDMAIILVFEKQTELLRMEYPENERPEIKIQISKLLKAKNN